MNPVTDALFFFCMGYIFKAVLDWIGDWQAAHRAYHYPPPRGSLRATARKPRVRVRR